MDNKHFSFYNNEMPKPKLITAKQVQQEYLPLSLHYVRLFLYTYCTCRKIGKSYFYSREEVEQKLLANQNAEYILNKASQNQILK